MTRVSVQVPVENKVPAQLQSDSEPVQANPNPTQPPKVKGFPYKKLFVIVFVIVGFVFVSNLIDDKKKLEQQVRGAQTSSVEDVVRQLSQSVELPSNETPQMRVIEDAARFTQQNPSLSDIKNGDQLLFFEKSKKVVVYRPSTKKAVVVVTLSQPTSQQNTPQ